MQHLQRQVHIVHVASGFEKSYKSLPGNIQKSADLKDKLFRSNVFDSRLKTHKLKGELDGYWAYSVNYQYRVLFRFISSDEVLYYDIGTHEIYK